MNADDKWDAAALAPSEIADFWAARCGDRLSFESVDFRFSSTSIVYEHVRTTTVKPLG